MRCIKPIYICCRWSIFARQIERARQQASRLRRKTIAPSKHQAACFASDKTRRARSAEELRSAKRCLRQLNHLASDIGKRRFNIDSSWSAKSRRCVDNARKRGRQLSVAVYQKHIRRDV